MILSPRRTVLGGAAVAGPLIVIAALIAAACGAPAESQELRAFGTEPFWGVEIGADGIELTDMGTGDTVRYDPVAPVSASARPDDLARAYVLAEDPLTVLMVRRAEDPGCSDGMSDLRYPYLALFLRGDRLYEGCARPPSEGG